MIKASLLLVLAACAVEQVPDMDPAPDLEPIARSCGPWGCMQNTALGPGDEIFDELDASQQMPNRHGIIIDSFRTELGVPLKVVIDRDHLVGIDGAGTPYTGPALNNAVMTFKRYGIPAFEAVFHPASNPPWFWGGDTSQYAIAYEITVNAIGASPMFSKQACRNNPPSPNEWHGSTTAAVIFAGDRYDDEAHTVSSSLGTPWFNIACAGGYPAKLHLLRQTWAGGFGSDNLEHWKTKVKQRQTYLRAIVADYEGDGSVWTHTGVPLFYGDSAGITPPILSGRLEAVWDSAGAVCIDDTRLGPAVVPLSTFPSRPCPSWPWPSDRWTQLGYVVTVIP